MAIVWMHPEVSSSWLLRAECFQQPLLYPSPCAAGSYGSPVAATWRATGWRTRSTGRSPSDPPPSGPATGTSGATGAPTVCRMTCPCLGAQDEGKLWCEEATMSSDMQCVCAMTGASREALQLASILSTTHVSPGQGNLLSRPRVTLALKAQSASDPQRWCRAFGYTAAAKASHAVAGLGLSEHTQLSQLRLVTLSPDAHKLLSEMTTDTTCVHKAGPARVPSAWSAPSSCCAFWSSALTNGLKSGSNEPCAQGWACSSTCSWRRSWARSRCGSSTTASATRRACLRGASSPGCRTPSTASSAARGQI